MSKGSKRRPGSDKAYREGWERIWGKNKKKQKCNNRKTCCESNRYNRVCNHEFE